MGCVCPVLPVIGILTETLAVHGMIPETLIYNIYAQKYVLDSLKGNKMKNAVNGFVFYLLGR